MNLKPETGLVPVLVGRILIAILVGGGSPVVHAVVKKARDPLAGAFDVSVAKHQQRERERL
jgi:hypothetical protein